MWESHKPLRIALVAGESSGDNLGAPLMRAIRRAHPDVNFMGIGGPAMMAEGLECWTDLDRLSVNGFVDPVKRLPDLVRILFSTRNKVLAAGVDCFIGVDFNFFNLLLERMLKSRGVTTVHYVSPTVWAWRKGRIKGIGKSVDLMLTLYPFETTIYEQHGISVAFVGHPKADEIDPGGGEGATRAAREALGFAAEDRVVAILPGSRGSEVKFTGPDFFRAAGLIVSSIPGARFVVPAANRKRRDQIEKLRAELCARLDIKVIEGQSTLAMQAADVVLVNSGTATLEAMLLKKPMVMSYRLGRVTYAIVSALVTTPYFALPNILARRALIPEFIQDEATPEALSAAVIAYLDSSSQSELIVEFDRMHRMLRRDAGGQAGNAVLALVGQRAVE